MSKPVFIHSLTADEQHQIALWQNQLQVLLPSIHQHSTHQHYQHPLPKLVAGIWHSLHLARQDKCTQHLFTESLESLAVVHQPLPQLSSPPSLSSSLPAAKRGLPHGQPLPQDTSLLRSSDLPTLAQVIVDMLLSPLFSHYRKHLAKLVNVATRLPDPQLPPEAVLAALQSAVSRAALLLCAGLSHISTTAHVEAAATALGTLSWLLGVAHPSKLTGPLLDTPDTVYALAGCVTAALESAFLLLSPEHQDPCDRLFLAALQCLNTLLRKSSALAALLHAPSELRHSLEQHCLRILVECHSLLSPSCLLNTGMLYFALVALSAAADQTPLAQNLSHLLLSEFPDATPALLPLSTLLHSTAQPLPPAVLLLRATLLQSALCAVPLPVWLLPQDSSAPALASALAFLQRLFSSQSSDTTAQFHACKALGAFLALLEKGLEKLSAKSPEQQPNLASRLQAALPADFQTVLTNLLLNWAFNWSNNTSFQALFTSYVAFLKRFGALLRADLTQSLLTTLFRLHPLSSKLLLCLLQYLIPETGVDPILRQRPLFFSELFTIVLSEPALSTPAVFVLCAAVEHLEKSLSRSDPTKHRVWLEPLSSSIDFFLQSTQASDSGSPTESLLQQPSNLAFPVETSVAVTFSNPADQAEQALYFRRLQPELHPASKDTALQCLQQMLLPKLLSVLPYCYPLLVGHFLPSVGTPPAEGWSYRRVAVVCILASVARRLHLLPARAFDTAPEAICLLSTPARAPAPSILVPAFIVHAGLNGLSPLVCQSALSLVAVSAKPTEPLSPLEVTLLKSSLPALLRSDDPYVIRHIEPTVLSLLGRIRDSVASLARAAGLQNAAMVVADAEAGSGNPSLFPVTEAAHDFLLWLFSECASALYPTAPHYQRRAALSWLSMMRSVFGSAVEAGGVGCAWFALGERAQRVSRGSGITELHFPLIVPLKSRGFFIQLLDALHDGYDEIRQSAFDLLQSVFLAERSSESGSHAVAAQATLSALFNDVSSCIREAELEESAKILRFLFAESRRRHSPEPLKDLLIFPAQSSGVGDHSNSNDVDMWTFLLSALVTVCCSAAAEIKSRCSALGNEPDSARVALIAGSHVRLPAILRCLRMLLEDELPLVLPSRNGARPPASAAERLGHVAQQVAASVAPVLVELQLLLAPVVNFAAPEGMVESVADDHAPEEDEGSGADLSDDDGDDNDDNNDDSNDNSNDNSNHHAAAAAFSARKSTCLTTVWRAVKQINLAIRSSVIILSRSLLGPEAFSSASAASTSLHLLADNVLCALLTARHKGAIEMTHIAFEAVCNEFAEHSLSPLPGHLVVWLVLILSSVGKQNFRGALLKAFHEQSGCPFPQFQRTLQRAASSTTRRSAGLPAVVVGIFTALAPSSTSTESAADRQRFVNDFTASLLDFSSSGLDPESIVHTLNILRSLFRDSFCADTLHAHLSTTFSLAMAHFSSRDWSIRNAATLLLSSILPRLAAVSHCASNAVAMDPIPSPSPSSLSSLPASALCIDLFASLPDLKAHVEGLLRGVAPGPVGDGGPDWNGVSGVETKLHIVLTLMESLPPMSTILPVQVSNVAGFEPLVRSFVASNPLVQLLHHCLASPVALTRLSAARASVAVIPPNLVHPYIALQLQAARISPSANKVHGTLAQCLSLLSHHLKSSADFTSSQAASQPSIANSLNDLLAVLVGSKLSALSATALGCLFDSLALLLAHLASAKQHLGSLGITPAAVLSLLARCSPLIPCVPGVSLLCNSLCKFLALWDNPIVALDAWREHQQGRDHLLAGDADTHAQHLVRARMFVLRASAQSVLHLCVRFPAFPNDLIERVAERGSTSGRPVHPTLLHTSLQTLIEIYRKVALLDPADAGQSQLLSALFKPELRHALGIFAESKAVSPKTRSLCFVCLSYHMRHLLLTSSQAERLHHQALFELWAKTVHSNSQSEAALESRGSAAVALQLTLPALFLHHFAQQGGRGRIWSPTSLCLLVCAQQRLLFDDDEDVRMTCCSTLLDAGVKEDDLPANPLAASKRLYGSLEAVLARSAGSFEQATMLHAVVYTLVFPSSAHGAAHLLPPPAGILEDVHLQDKFLKDTPNEFVDEVSVASSALQFMQRWLASAHEDSPRSRELVHAAHQLVVCLLDWVLSLLSEMDRRSLESRVSPVTFRWYAARLLFAHVYRALESARCLSAFVVAQSVDESAAEALVRAVRRFCADFESRAPLNLKSHSVISDALLGLKRHAALSEQSQEAPNRGDSGREG